MTSNTETERFSLSGIIQSSIIKRPVGTAQIQPRHDQPIIVPPPSSTDLKPVTKNFYFGVISPRNLFFFLVSFWLVHMTWSWASCRRTAVLFLESGGYFPAVLPITSMVVLSSPDGWLMKLSYLGVTPSCSVTSHTITAKLPYLIHHSWEGSQCFCTRSFVRLWIDGAQNFRRDGFVTFSCLMTFMPWLHLHKPVVKVRLL